MERETLKENKIQGKKIGVPRCQIFCVTEIADPLGTQRVLFERRNRVKRILKRRWNYVTNYSKEKFMTVRGEAGKTIKKSKTDLKPGDMVRVKSRGEIRSTLDRWNQLKGCAFMEEMLPYCGTIQKVFKKVEKFLDERDYLMKKCKGIVILEGVFCEGTKDFGPCDRTCFFFWKEDWLEKIDETP